MSAPPIALLRTHGFVVVPGFLAADAAATLRGAALRQLAASAPPLELEADLAYPGAPASRGASGGATVRRLLDAYGREPLFAQLSTAPQMRAWMEAYFGGRTCMSRVHHNCLMTKHPRFGSLTGWHQDIRYWSFAREDLVSVWLALGDEEVDNGALWFVPGSHRMEFPPACYDAAKFFLGQRADDATLLGTAVSPRLAAGDAVLFHCRTLHSAGRNSSEAVKLSLVFTYHGADNPPRSGTRSASRPEVPLGGP